MLIIFRANTKLFTTSSAHTTLELASVKASADQTRAALVSLDPLTTMLVNVLEPGRAPSCEEKAVAGIQAFLRSGPTPSIDQVRLPHRSAVLRFSSPHNATTHVSTAQFLVFFSCVCLACCVSARQGDYQVLEQA